MGPLRPEEVKVPLGWVGGGAREARGERSEGRPEGEEAEGQGACRTDGGTGGEDDPGVGWEGSPPRAFQGEKAFGSYSMGGLGRADRILLPLDCVP